MSQKLFVFLLFPASTALIYGFVFAAFNMGKGFILLPIAMAIGFFFLALFLIQSLLITKFMEAAMVILTESVFLVGPILLTGNFNVSIYMAFAAILLFLLWGHHSGQKESRNMINLNFFRLRHAILTKGIIGMSLFSVLIYISFIDLSNFSIAPNPLSYFTRPVEYVGGLFIQEFSVNMTIGQFLSFVAKNNLSAETPREIQDLTVENLAERIKGWTDFNFSLRQRFGDVVYQSINYQFKRIKPDQKTPFLIGIGFVIFLFVTGFGLLFSWIIVIVGWFIYQLLLSYNFIKISYASKPVERITV